MYTKYSIRRSLAAGGLPNAFAMTCVAVRATENVT
jgi:hypothetical protein